MREFHIGNGFIISTEKAVEEMQEIVFKPTQISSSNDKPTKYIATHKTREFTVFDSLFWNGEIVIDDLFALIDFIVILKGYNQKKLEPGESYKSSRYFIAKIGRNKQNKEMLVIDFKNHDKLLHIDRIKCAQIAAKIGKILQKCEAY